MERRREPSRSRIRSRGRCSPPRFVALLGLLSTLPDVATAEVDSSDDFELRASSRTYLRIFEQTVAPGPDGSAVTTETLAPAYEYLSLRGARIDTPWGKDALDLELSGWLGTSLLGDRGDPNPDGDITVAHVTQRMGPVYFRVGRQIVTTSAARFSPFDGVGVGLITEAGVEVTAYGGFAVLPRWSERPSYHLLGSAFDTWLEAPEALPRPERANHWVTGGRLRYAYHDLLQGSVAFHRAEERGDLGASNLGFDGVLSPWSTVELAASVLLDLDRVMVAEAEGSVDLYPTEDLSVALQARHAVPALLLSKQSVFSAFSGGSFDELGADCSYALGGGFSFGIGQYAELLPERELGMRTLVRVRVEPDRARRLRLQLVYGRVQEPENGYHSLRVSGSVALARPLTFVGEQAIYLYDEPIRGTTLSAVESLNLAYQGSFPLQLVLGGSLVSSPYAFHDAQATLRLVYEGELTGRRL